METLLYKVAAAYIRVSDERQDEYSPDSQLKKIREFAAHDGYQIPEEYVFYDDGISGRSTRKRGDFNRMIAMAKEKPSPFAVIYVWKFSRFARNQEESMVYKNLLRKKGVSVVSVSEPIPEGHYGTLIERIIEWMDEFYLINLGAEVMRGMTEKASRGEPTCAPPFGYIMKDKKYYPDEESGAADIVREIFQRYLDGEGMREIAARLNERGIKTQTGGKIDNRRIDYMLHNPCYVGKIRFCPDGSKSVSKRHYDNENIMTIDGHHDPIIALDVWEAVQERLQKTKKEYPKYARKEQSFEYMVKGMVRCSACGATLAASGRSGKKGTRCLQCCNYARGSCSVSHSVTVPKIEDALIKGLEASVKNKTFNMLPTKTKSDHSPMIDYKKLIVIEERRLQRAREAYLAEVDTIEQYKKNKKEIEEKIQALISEQEKAFPVETDTHEYTKRVLSVIDLIKNPNVAPKAKNEALRTVVSKIVYEKPKENLAIYFHDI